MDSTRSIFNTIFNSLPSNIIQFCLYLSGDLLLLLCLIIQSIVFIYIFEGTLNAYQKRGKNLRGKKERKTKQVGMHGGILFVTCWFAVEPLFILRFTSPPRLFSTPDLRVWKERVPQCEPVFYTFSVEGYMFSTMLVAVLSIMTAGTRRFLGTDGH